MYLAKHVDIDSDLKKIQLALASACQSAVDLKSEAKAIRVWFDNMESAVRSGVSTESIISSLEELKLSADCFGKSAIDIIPASSWSMLFGHYRSSCSKGRDASMEQ